MINIQVETRWNTLHEMICSVLENLDGINRILIQIDVKNMSKILTDEEVKILREICMMIAPFKEATEKISGMSSFSFE